MSASRKAFAEMSAEDLLDLLAEKVAEKIVDILETRTAFTEAEKHQKQRRRDYLNAAQRAKIVAAQKKRFRTYRASQKRGPHIND
jgi:hypothetical protein